jgi:hypothetical protein
MFKIQLVVLLSVKTMFTGCRAAKGFTELNSRSHTEIFCVFGVYVGNVTFSTIHTPSQQAQILLYLSSSGLFYDINGRSFYNLAYLNDVLQNRFTVISF